APTQGTWRADLPPRIPRSGGGAGEHRHERSIALTRTTFRVSSKIVRQHPFRLAHPRLIKQTLDEGEPRILGELRKPGLHFSCEALPLRRTRPLPREKRNESPKVIRVYGLFGRKSIFERVHPAARATKGLQMARERIEALVAGQDCALGVRAARELLS